jgi:hypothetical protein
MPSRPIQGDIVGNARVIKTGALSSAPYLAFGDDSQFGDVLAYAVIIVRRTKLRQIESRLSALKERFRIPKQIALHCRELFHVHPRQKAGLSHLSDENARAIVAHAITILNQGDSILRYTIGNLSYFRTIIGDELEFTHESDGSKMNLSAKVDPKGLLGIMMHACFSVPPDGSSGPNASECQIFASEDRTKVKFIGPGGRRADGLYSGYSDIGAPEGVVFQLQPTLLKPGAVPLLQLADIAAYMCSHSADTSLQGRFFLEQLSRVRYWVRAEFTANSVLQGTHDTAARP